MCLPCPAHLVSGTITEQPSTHRSKAVQERPNTTPATDRLLLMCVPSRAPAIGRYFIGTRPICVAFSKCCSDRPPTPQPQRLARRHVSKDTRGGDIVRQWPLIRKAFHRLRGAYPRVYRRPDDARRLVTAWPGSRSGGSSSARPPPPAGWGGKSALAIGLEPQPHSAPCHTSTDWPAFWSVSPTVCRSPSLEIC
jgi:hypothetical protein